MLTPGIPAASHRPHCPPRIRTGNGMQHQQRVFNMASHGTRQLGEAARGSLSAAQQPGNGTHWQEKSPFHLGQFQKTVLFVKRNGRGIDCIRHHAR